MPANPCDLQDLLVTVVRGLSASQQHLPDVLEAALVARFDTTCSTTLPTTRNIMGLRVPLNADCIYPKLREFWKQ
ncbi:unnamed protein product, partial [Nesidiocoris tenuis]